MTIADKIKTKKITTFNQYKNDFFNKLQIDFKKGKKILDVGCGDGSDANIFIREYGLKFYGIDVLENPKIKLLKINFKKAGINKIPHGTESFDYVFTHDVLHHINEENSSEEPIISGLRELNRVCKKNGLIIVVEANRFNPLFFPHMVLMKGHNHLPQKKFKSIIQKSFENNKIQFKFFEAHRYPDKFLKLFKIYEYIFEHFFPKQFFSYNAAIVRKI